MTERYYFDYAATTPLDERVLDTMLPFFSATFGNPSSVHIWGQRAEAALEDARENIAAMLHAYPDEIVFTACGSESDNLALRGGAHAKRERTGANHLLISPVEHHAVSHTAFDLAREGFEVEMLPVDAYGRVDPIDVARRIQPRTALVSVIYANNEIGTINPIAAIGQICREHGVLFHTDAVQAAAHLKMDVEADCVDLLSLGAHKFYGPKGVGLLYVRRGTPIRPIQTGGGQERGLRAGTQNVPFIVGMAAALRFAQDGLEERQVRFTQLREQLIGAVLENVPDTRLSGHPVERLPNHASFVFHGVDGNQLLAMLDIAGFGCSSGSACKTGSPKPSEVLTALGLSDEWALGSLRVTFGQDTNPAGVNALAAVLPGLISRLRGLA